MTLEYEVTRLEGYTSREREMNLKLNELFAEWHSCLKAGAAGRFDPAWFITDGFYPQYTRQKKKILFIGWEGLWLHGGNYIDQLYHWYKNLHIDKTPVGRHKFHRLLLKIAYGLNHGCLPWAEIPPASALAETFASPGGLSFAFMNFSKLSNETKSRRPHWPAIAAFLECSQSSGGHFFNREIGILDPDLIIAMNLNDEWLNSLGEIKTLASSREKLGHCLLKVNGRETLLLNSFHFSAPYKSDEFDYYEPMAEAVKNYQAGA